MRIERFVGEPAACVAALVADLGAEYARASARPGARFALAVPGGSAAAHAFPAFATLGFDWSRVDVFWGDERAVPPADADSNYALAASLWLGPARVPAGSVHRMPADRPDLTAAAAAYEAELTRVAGPAGRLDYVLLGVGPDGHVASLFPGHAALGETARLVVAVEDAPKPPPRRLTLTLPVLAGARRVVVMTFGAVKAAALGDALADPRSPLPVARVLRQSARPLLVADRAAAARLPGV